ncbi:MAG: hydrolase [Betaproteobacteria bacterium]|nr:hydrolase [Betaproteobacteria bacterium]
MVLTDPPPYAAPRWLPGGHLQTLYAATLMPRPGAAYRRSRWDTPDGDFIDVDWAESPVQGSKFKVQEETPLVVLFHGLEGSSRSHYALALMAALRGRGMRGVVVHFRGCGGEPNRLPRAYHSGDAPEIDWILRRLRAQNPGAPLYAVGISLGGNALLKWLGESGDAAVRVIDAAAAVSAPLDLMASGDALGQGFNLVYARNFLKTLRVKSLAKLERFPGLYDAGAVRASRTLREFDDLVTAPLHGYRDTDDYWTRASSKPGLRNIRVSTLVINARNDPFLPAAALPRADEVSAAVTLEQPGEGGHVGFVGGAPPGNFDWLPRRVLEFFTSGNGK